MKDVIAVTLAFGLLGVGVVLALLILFGDTEDDESYDWSHHLNMPDEEEAQR